MTNIIECETTNLILIHKCFDILKILYFQMGIWIRTRNHLRNVKAPALLHMDFNADFCGKFLLAICAFVHVLRQNILAGTGLDVFGTITVVAESLIACRTEELFNTGMSIQMGFVLILNGRRMMLFKF